MIRPQDFYTLYREKFLVVYSDLVALTTAKPQQILIEESNILSHFVRYNDPTLDSTKRQDNLNKAYNHLVRATLDLHKLIWAEIRKKLDAFIVEDPHKRICFNISEEDVLKKYQEFISKARFARQTEMQEIGRNTALAIKSYEDVNKLGFDLFEALDFQKEARVEKLQNRFKIKKFSYKIFAGVLIYVLGMISEHYKPVIFNFFHLNDGQKKEQKAEESKILEKPLASKK